METTLKVEIQTGQGLVPAYCAALREWQVDQAAEREAAGSHWQDTGRVSRLIRPEETSYLRVTAGAVGPPVLTHACRG
jgi:hypothetical protein